MGKNRAPAETTKDVSTFPIHKNKTLKANLDAYTKLLKSKYAHLPSKEYLVLVHNYISRYTKLNRGLPHSMIIQSTYKIKICRKCDRWALGTQKMVQCNICEDMFHLVCAGDSARPKQEWLCQSCNQMNLKLLEIESKAEGQREPQSPSCSKCDAKKEEDEVRCMRCQKKYHASCFGAGIVVCEGCDKEITSKVKKSTTRQLNLRESFKRAIDSEQRRAGKKSSRPKSEQKTKKQKVALKVEPANKKTRKKDCDDVMPCEDTKKTLISESTNHSTQISNSRRFVAEFPPMTEEEIEEYRKGLLYAIMAKKMEYASELQPQNCSLEDDIEESLDFAVQHISHSDNRMFQKHKQQPIGPFILRFTKAMGYDVVADKDLPKGMIVCEYVGDVYTNRELLQIIAHEPNDSIMELKKGPNADESLSIAPRKYTNIARFINGTKKGQGHKANVQTVKGLAKGRPVVILYTVKPIRKGESLMYDYNMGEAAIGIDTSHFV